MVAPAPRVSEKSAPRAEDPISLKRCNKARRASAIALSGSALAAGHCVHSLCQEVATIGAKRCANATSAASLETASTKAAKSRSASDIGDDDCNFAACLQALRNLVNVAHQGGGSSACGGARSTAGSSAPMSPGVSPARRNRSAHAPNPSGSIAARQAAPNSAMRGSSPAESWTATGSTPAPAIAHACSRSGQVRPCSSQRDSASLSPLIGCGTCLIRPSCRAGFRRSRRFQRSTSRAAVAALASSLVGPGSGTKTVAR